MDGDFDRGRYVSRGNQDIQQRNYYDRSREPYGRYRDNDRPRDNSPPPRRNNNNYNDDFGRVAPSHQHSRYGNNSESYAPQRRTTVEFQPDAMHRKRLNDSSSNFSGSSSGPRFNRHTIGEHSAGGSSSSVSPVLLSFREFMHNLDARIPEHEAVERYNIYKRDYRRKLLSRFFDEHKEQEWFREKYEPEESAARKKLKRARLLRRKEIFLWLMQNNYLDELALETNNSDNVVRLLDTVVVRLEGGTEDDVKNLNAAVAGTDDAKKSDDLVPDDGSVRKKSEKKDSTAAKNSRERDDDDAVSTVSSSASSMPSSTPVQQPRWMLQKTSSIFLKNVAPTITKSELEAVLRKHEGYLRLCMSEPMPERNFYRRAWITFRQGVNVKDISWKLDTLRMRDSALGAIVNKDLSRRCRPVDGFYAHAPVARECLKIATRLVEVLDAQLFVWSEPSFSTVNKSSKHKKSPYESNHASKRHKHSADSRSPDDAVTAAAASSSRSRGDNNKHHSRSPGDDGDDDDHDRKSGADRHHHSSSRDADHHRKRKRRDSAGDDFDDDEDDAAATKRDYAGHGSNVSSPDDNALQQSASSSLTMNPVLQGITHFLIDEADALEEELIGGIKNSAGADGSVTDSAAGQKSSTEPQLIQREEELLAAVDKVIAYLRIVHSIDFYSAIEYPLEDEMPQRCGLIHVRNSDERMLPAAFNADQVVGQFQQRLAPLFKQHEQQRVPEDELQELGVRIASDYVEKFIAANVVSLGPEKFLCPLSNKKFKAAEFVRKHILNKHMERLDEVRREVAFFNNYLRDPKRPMPLDAAFGTLPQQQHAVSGAAGGGLQTQHAAAAAAAAAMMQQQQQAGGNNFMNPAAQMMATAFAAAMSAQAGNMARMAGSGGGLPFGATVPGGFPGAAAMMSRFGSSANGYRSGNGASNVSYQDLDQPYESDLF